MYKDKALSSEQRAKHLLAQMTVDEKIDQMVFYIEVNMLRDALEKGESVPTYAGTFGNLSHLNDNKAINEIQDYFIKNNRFGIPMLMCFEALHGLYHSGATVFPQSAGLGGSFNPDNIKKMADIIGKECRAVGIRQVFAPNIDIPRDPRWGRTQEAYSEDPYLVGEMGAAYVKGVQQNGVAATAKHFIAYGVPECGINLSPAHIGEREIREVMLEPFKKCIDAGVYSVMPSYNEVDGEPLHSSEKWLRHLLRDELGFKGTTIADWAAVNMLHSFHHVAKDAFSAGEMAIKAGVDIEAPCPSGYNDEFRQAVKDGKIDISLIDEAVLRVLTLKFELGLFENPYTDDSLKLLMNNDEAKALARKMDEEAILLLKNDGILPLDQNKVGKVAVIGNNAKDSYLGNYIGQTENCISFYDGMVDRLGADKVLYARGCNHIFTTDEMVNEAVEQAKKADTVFLVLGDSTDTGGGVGGGEFKNTEITCGEGYDTHDLGLTPSQKRLFNEIMALGKPTVLCFYAGRPYAIKNEVDKVNAFMFSFGGGEQNGIAFANLIFGDKSPSAKLSFSFPQSVGHLPCYYNHKPSARGSLYKKPGSPTTPGRDYVLASPDPWLPFGFGLSYTELCYSDLTAKVKGDKVTVTVNVENKGSYEIDESVLLFVKMMHCPITPFVKKLRSFKKVNLKPGDKKQVSFTLDSSDFTYIDKNMQTAVNHGTHKVLVDNLECSFEY